jgi:hypothetical protein
LLNYAAELERLAIEQKKYSDELWVDKHNLEFEKAELIEDLKFIAEQEDAQYINDILKKHGVEI